MLFFIASSEKSSYSVGFLTSKSAPTYSHTDLCFNSNLTTNSSCFLKFFSFIFSTLFYSFIKFLVCKISSLKLFNILSGFIFFKFLSASLFKAIKFLYSICKSFNSLYLNSVTLYNAETFSTSYLASTLSFNFLWVFL